MNDSQELLVRIARYSILHGSFTNNLGLLNGKMGIALFFYHYARYTEKKIYDDFAGELIDEIYKEIYVDSSLNFENGLCGIAWGIEYLIRNRFAEANSNEILEDLDKRIIEWDVRRIRDYSLETGLKGIASYVVSRRENRNRENPFLTREYMNDLIISLKTNKSIDSQSSILIQQLQKILDNKEIPSPYNPVSEIIGKIKYKKDTLFKEYRSLGIDKGYAGIGLQLMKIQL